MSDHTRLEYVEKQLAQRELELQQAKESLSRFTYAISHELDSPIRLLNNLLGMLNEEHHTQLDGEGNELLGMICKSAQRTQALVAGIIDYSSYCNPEIEHTRLDCQLVLEAALDDLSSVIADRAATIDVGPMPWMMSSAPALKQLFYQLISNALIYTAHDGQSPIISISASESINGINFIVDDQGIGIDPEYRERIFNPFERLNPKSEYEGVGLGLSQCRQIVHALQGRLWVTAGEHGGSAFHVYLPHLTTTSS